MALPEPLSAAQLKRLEQHHYSASGRSLLEAPLQLYWAWLVERTPLWMAPNAITLGGFVLNVLPMLALIACCPTATEEAPFWLLFLCALGLFVYQSLDAIDGKQARRTNSSSPLGELFDHGCDSITIVFVSIGSCIAVRLGTNPDWLFFCCFIGSVLFYCAHWQTYVSGMLKFSKIDVTEVQLASMLLFLISAFGGTTIWDMKLPVLDLRLKMVPVAGMVLGAINSSYHYFKAIFGGGVGKNGSTIAGTSVLSPGLHIGLIITLAFMIYKKSTTHLFEKHPCLYVLTFGFVSAKITQKLVIAHMTKSEIFLQDTAFIGPGLLFLDQYFNGFIDEYIILWIALFISLLDLLRYFIGLCIQIAAHLHIHVFKISSHQAPEQVQVVSSLSHQNNMD
uniref:Cholinephosphotransferase 1 n=1 Tax=Salvator merianae TaxID=96440 RepID=A0A8D0C4D1_SALMN